MELGRASQPGERGTGTDRNSPQDMNKKKKRREKADDKRRGWPLGRSPGARGMILWTFVAVLQCTVKGIHSILRFSTHWGPLVTANQSVDAGGAAIRWLEVGR